MHSFFFLIIILEKNENTLKNVEKKNVNNLWAIRLDNDPLMKGKACSTISFFAIKWCNITLKVFGIKINSPEEKHFARKW